MNIIMYRAEVWSWTNGIRNKIPKNRTVEIDYMRNDLQITRKDKIWTEYIGKKCK